jgi:hypothetical protein
MHNYMKNLIQEAIIYNNIFIYETKFIKYLTVDEVNLNK